MNEESLFAAALEKSDPADRRAFLDAACGDDRRLRDRVEQLLAADDRPRAVFDRVPAPADLLAAARPPDTTTAAEAPTRPPDGPPPAPDVPGYAVLAEVARGGMGVVYRARQVGLNRDVALKMLLGPDAVDERGIVRFLAEAEAMAAVDHAHVVRVFEFGRHAGRPFLAMEYLSGGTLADRLKGGPAFAPAEGAALVRKLAAGVGAAHDLGIVHRDIKPGNVLFDDKGEPKVADFGLAKRGTGADLTRTGAVMGTPAYMSPEQARGNARQAGPAADVWALGVILYECLTGRRPFAGPDPWAVLDAVLTADPPAPRSANPTVPRDLDLVCRKCLAKEPRDRYPTAGALADDLGRFLAGRPVTARPAGLPERAYKWARRRPAVAGLAAAVLGLLAASLPAVTLLWLRAEGALGQADDARRDAQDAEKAAVKDRIDADQARVRARDLLLRRYAASAARGLDDGDPVAALMWSAEGLKEAAGDPAREREHRVRLANGLRRCWTLAGAWPVSVLPDQAPIPGLFTPDGRAVLVCGDGVAQLVDVETGRPVRGPWGARTSTAGGPWPAWRSRANPDPTIDQAVLSPDGKFVAGNSLSGHAVWDVRTGERVLLGEPGGAWEGVFDPTGRRVAFIQGDRVVVHDLPDGRVAAELTGLPGRAGGLVFGPAGDRLIVGYWLPGQTEWVVRAWDVKSNRPIGADHRRVMGALSWDRGTAAFDRATGAPLLAWAEHVKGEVRVRDLATGGEQVLAVPAGVEQQPEQPQAGRVRFSPDGTRVVAVGSQRIHLWDLATGKPTCPPLRTANDDLFDWTAEFDPGGGPLVVYNGGPDGEVSVWDVPHGRRFAQFRHPGGVQSHRFSTDGRLLLTAGKDATVRVWDIMTGKAVGWPLAHCGPVRWAGFAPDGQRVWSVCKPPGLADDLCCVWDRPTDDDPHPVSPPADRHARWGRFAGAHHVVTHNFVGAGGKTALRAAAIETGRAARPLLTLGPGLLSYPDRGGLWSPTPAAWNADLSRVALVTNWQPGGDYSSSAATRVEVWDWAAGRRRATLLDEPTGMIKAVEFAARGDRLLTLYEDKDRGSRLDLWNATTGAKVATLAPPAAPGRQKADEPRRTFGTTALFGRDGATVFTIGGREPNGRGTGLLAWDATTNRPEGGHPFDGALDPVALDPDGRLLVTSGWSRGNLMSDVWDLTTGKPVRLWSLAEKVTAAQFGPGGRLVTAVRAETGAVVRVWDVASGRPLTPAVSWTNPVRQVAFDPAGGQILVVSTGRWSRGGVGNTWGEVQVLDAGTGQPLTPRLTATRDVLDARFTPDGRAVEALLGSGSVVRWDCSPSDESPALLARLAAVQTGRELDPSGTPVPLPPDRLIGAVAALRAERPDRFRPAPGAPDSVANLTRLIEAAPKDPLLYVRRAHTHDRAGNFRAAEADWSRAIQLDPSQPRWWFERGVIRAYRLALYPGMPTDKARRFWDDGTADLLAVIDRVPLDPDDHFVLHEVVWSVVKDPEAGADRHRSAARLAEAARAGWINFVELTTLGLARYRVGRYPEAVEALAASERLRPGHPVNLAALAMAHHRLRDGAKAAQLLGQAQRAAGRPEFARDPEVVGLLREAEQTIAGGVREVVPPPRPVGR